MEFGSPESVIEQSDEFESYSAGIGDPRVVFHLLSTFYSNKQRIIAQEYLANARDAHREKNNSDIPFEVTLPTIFTPNLVIRDFGPGITPDRIAHVFIHVGATTKSGDNKYIGGFGIGAKCAFCYVDSFEVETYIDGIVRSYVFVKSGKDGMPEMNLIYTSNTDEADGTKITIAIDDEDRDTVIKYVYSTTQFWDVKPKIINPHVSSEGWKELVCFSKGSNWLYLKQSYFGTCAVVDGIPYYLNLKALYSEAASAELMKGLFNSERMILLFDQGEVKINPNREGLQYDTDTILAVRARIDQAVKDISDEYEKNVNACNNAIDAINTIKTYTELRDIVNLNYTWRGIDLHEFKVDSRFFKFCRISSYRNKLSLEVKNVFDLYYEITTNLVSFYFNDEESIDMARIKTIYNGYNKYIIIDMCEYVRPDNLTDEEAIKDEEEFKKLRNEYDAKFIAPLNSKLLSSVEKYKKPKSPKVIGNIYRFIRNSCSFRNAWSCENVDYSEINGYYVTFNRGDAVGYTYEALAYIKNKYSIDIFGVPERYKKQIKDNVDLSPLSDFIQGKLEDFKQYLEANKEVIYAKKNINTRYLENVYFIDTINKSLYAEIKDLPEMVAISDTMKKVSDLRAIVYDSLYVDEMYKFFKTLDISIENIIEDMPHLNMQDYNNVLVMNYPLFGRMVPYTTTDEKMDDILEYVRLINMAKLNMPPKFQNSNNDALNDETYSI
jgi:hypothetical protein